MYSFTKNYNLYTWYYKKKGKTALYLKSKSWGLTGNHKITVLSKNPQQEFHLDTTSEYIFNGFEEIIYSIEEDTLKIFSWQSPKQPEKFDSEIQIKPNFEAL